MKLEILDTDPLVYCIHDFLLPQECQSYIALGEKLGFTPAPLTTAQGPVMDANVRNHTRVMLDDVGLAKGLWARLCHLAPLQARAYDDDLREACGLNERFRFFRYDAQQRFARHYDGAFYRNPDEGSLLTFLIYLNDDFEGGQTRFFDDDGSLRFALSPRTGTALLFAHNQLHEGAWVTQGRKYALRSDVMYRRARVAVGA